MKLFTVKLTDDERARLEAHRAAMGERAQTDVIRRWIAGPVVSDRQPLEPPDLPDVRQQAPIPPTRHPTVSVSGKSASKTITVSGKSAAQTVPFGPVQRRPGDLAKKGKKP